MNLVALVEVFHFLTEQSRIFVKHPFVPCLSSTTVHCHEESNGHVSHGLRLAEAEHGWMGEAHMCFLGDVKSLFL